VNGVLIVFSFFAAYGSVIDVKIFTSSTSKVPYGFVAFSDEQPVKAILSEKVLSLCQICI